MTEDDLLRLIDSANATPASEMMFRRPLSDHVDFALVWTHLPRGGIWNEGAYPAYLLLDDERRCIGIVLDMRNDLHAVVVPMHRRRGHLTAALLQVILPHLRQRDPKRGEQRLTFTDPELALRCCEKWGFRRTGELAATVPFEAIDMPPPPSPPDRKPTREEFNLMRRRIDQARLYVEMVRDQLSQISGRDCDELEWFINGFSDLEDIVQDHIESTCGAPFAKE